MASNSKCCDWTLQFMEFFRLQFLIVIVSLVIWGCKLPTKQPVSANTMVIKTELKVKLHESIRKCEILLKLMSPGYVYDWFGFIENWSYWKIWPAAARRQRPRFGRIYNYRTSGMALRSFTVRSLLINRGRKIFKKPYPTYAVHLIIRVSEIHYSLELVNPLVGSIWWTYVCVKFIPTEITVVVDENSLSSARYHALFMGTFVVLRN